MSLSYLIDEKNVDRGIAPVTHEFTDEWDIIKSAIDYQDDNLNFTSESRLLSEVKNERNAKFEQLYGKSLDSMSSSTSDGRDLYNTVEKTIEQKRKEGAQGWESVLTDSEIRQEAINRAKDAKIKFNEARMYAAPDTWKETASFAGQAAGWFADPIQAGIAVASIPVSAAGAAFYGGGVLSAMGIEAAIGGITEAVVQPSVMDWQHDVGEEYTLKDAAIAVSLSTMGGAAFAGIAHAGAAAINFRGIHPDTIRKWMNLTPEQELKRMPEGATDSAAFAHNAEVSAKAMDEFKIPDPAEFKREGMGRIFDSAEPAYEHGEIAKAIIGGDIKNADEFKKTKFIEAVKDEYRILSELPRYAKDELDAGIAAAKKEYIDAANIARNAREKSSNYAALKIESADDVQRLIALDDTAKIAEVVKNQAIANLEMQKSKARISDISADAVSKLSKLEQGHIPSEIMPRFEQYSNAVESALKDIKKYEKTVRGIAHRIINGNNVDVVYPKKYDIEAALNPAPEIEKAAELNVKREIADAVTDGAPEQRFKIIGDDGSEKEMTMRELMDDIGDEEIDVKQIQACAIGKA